MFVHPSDPIHFLQLGGSDCLAAKRINGVINGPITWSPVQWWKSSCYIKLYIWYVSTHIYIYVYIYVYMYICVYIYIYIYIHMHILIYVYVLGSNPTYLTWRSSHSVTQVRLTSQRRRRSWRKRHCGCSSKWQQIREQVRRTSPI